MKAHNAWTIEFQRDIPSQVFRLILKAVQKARSAFGVSCTETRKNISIQYAEKKRLTRDLTGLGQITRETLSEFFNRNFQGKRRGSANVICNKEKPFSIQYERRSSKVIVECHYTFTKEFGFTFESQFYFYQDNVTPKDPYYVPAILGDLGAVSLQMALGMLAPD